MNTQCFAMNTPRIYNEALIADSRGFMEANGDSRGFMEANGDSRGFMDANGDSRGFMDTNGDSCVFMDGGAADAVPGYDSCW